MTFSLRISGPGVSRELRLDPNGAEIIAGRAHDVDITLSDTEKRISRKHLAIRVVEDGIEIRVLSTVNGTETSRGTLDRGERTRLTAGDYFSLGPFRIDVTTVESVSDRHKASPVVAYTSQDVLSTGDPFDALLGIDPFAKPEFKSTPQQRTNLANDPFSELSAPSIEHRPEASVSGPLSEFLGGDSFRADIGKAEKQGAHAVDRWPSEPGTRSLDEWLRSGAVDSTGEAESSGPLDSFLGGSKSAVPRALSPDHVHGMHLPFGSSTPKNAAPLPQFGNPSHSPVSLRGASTVNAWEHLLNESVESNRHPGLPTSNIDPPRSHPTDLGNDHPFSHPDGAVTDVFHDLSRQVSTASQPSDKSPPFVDVETMPSMEQGRTKPQRPDADAYADVWLAFNRGLGAPVVTDMSDSQSAESAGKMVRTMVDGLAALLAARSDLKREMHAKDRTMLRGRNNNPFKLKFSTDDLLQYIFSTHTGGGYMPPSRAVQEGIQELRVHEHATIAAARAAVAGALTDFDPDLLKRKVNRGKPGLLRLLNNSKLWDAHQREYRNRSENMADWLEAVFSRFFMPTYAKETERLNSQSDVPDAPREK